MIAAFVLLFVFSQFTDLDDYLGIDVPFVSDLVQTTTDGRRGLNEDAFRVGQVGVVKASDTPLTLPDLFRKL